MPDFSAFIKSFNNALPAPTNNINVPFIVRSGGTGGSDVGVNGAASGMDYAPLELPAQARLWDSTWRQLLMADAAARENGRMLSSSAAAISSMVSAVTSANGSNGATVASTTAITQPVITIGRMAVSTEDRWRIQAQMRREEAKSGQSRKEYNKKVTRAIISTKGPGPDGFPVGRGRPV